MTRIASAAPHAVFDRALLARRRDRAADSFARHDFLLAHATEDIAERLSLVRRRFETVLVLGAHHGLPARRLRALPDIGLVLEADTSARLLAHCDGPSVMVDEEALPFGEGTLDLVIAPLTLHHVNDLPGSLIQIRRALKPDGLMLASILGGATLAELRSAFLAADAETTQGASPRIAPFADVRDAGALLQRAGFALPVADSDSLTVSYATPLDLMREVRGMGAANALLDRTRAPLRRHTLMRACEIYAQRYGDGGDRVLATFEIVTLTGWAPHDSQPKPLRPGSATARLADALGAPRLPAKDGTPG